MKQGSAQEPSRNLKPWHFGLLLFAFYLFWGGIFTEVSIAEQIVFNFAVFYPAGFIAGYFKTRSRAQDVYVAGFLFNLLTYGLAFAGGQQLNLLLVGIDFSSMFLCIFIGILVGKRTESK